MNDQLTALTSRLISFKSINKKNVNLAAEFCYSWLKDNNLEVELLENQGYKIVVATVGGEGPTIILNGHLDVVPAKLEDFNPYVKQGKLFGRGSYDMLGSVAAMMVLFKELAVLTPVNKILLTLVPNEEDGGQLGTGYLVEQGLTGDFVVCGEPTNLNIAVQIKGVLQLSLEIPGISCHGSRPWLGENAILKAVEAYRKIEELNLFKERSQYFLKPSLNLAKISGGKQFNQVADKCSIGLDIRYLPNQDPDNIIENIIKSVPEAKISIVNQRPTVVTDPNNKFIKKLIKNAEHYTDKNIVLFGQDGTSDISFFAKKEIPAVEFGPCGANHHGPGEYVEIESLYIFKDILKRFLLY